MENHSYSASITESGKSSPENEFENPPPWEDQPPSNSNNHKLKFMCSYGGKIHPRPHDNQLSYIGGETKILAVDRSIKFSGMISKLLALCDSEICFKYQLPGEDLDSLISVTNDDDLEHLIHEYDRLCMKSTKPARLRLFLFPASFASDEVKSDPERFVDAPNSVPIQASNDVDFLFGSDQISESTALEKEIRVACTEDRVIGSDSIHSQISDLQRLQIGGHEQTMYRRKSDDNLVGGFAGDYYYQKMPEKVPPATSPVTVQSPATLPTGYWPENQMVTGAFPTATLGAAQPVYMIQSQASVYHAPYGRPVTVSAGQGYYAVQSMPSEVNRNQPVYNFMQPMASAPPQQLGGPPSNGGVGVTDTGYAQMAYDSGMGRQVFYAATGGVTVMPPPYQAVNGGVRVDMAPSGALNQEGKVVTNVSQQASV